MKFSLTTRFLLAAACAIVFGGIMWLLGANGLTQAITAGIFAGLGWEISRLDGKGGCGE